MRLSFIFELLLIFIFIAFAASRVIDDTKGTHTRAAIRKQNSVLKNRQQVQDAANKYCSCNTKLCNCCREFNLPVVALQGPGCASLQYLRGDKLAITMSFGERVLTNTTIDSRKPKPVCMPLPGGVSKFCGRVYNIGRQGEDFNACLGLELRAVKDVEASVRVSCFKFGPKGLKVEQAQPLPTVAQPLGSEDDDEEDDEDDDEDEFDFDDDDEDEEEEDEVEDEDGDNSVDYGTFGVFDDDFLDTLFISGGSVSSAGTKKKKLVSTTKAPVRTVTRKPVTTAKPILSTTTLTPVQPLKDAAKKPTTEKPQIVGKISTTTQSSRRKTKATQRTPVYTTAASSTTSKPHKVTWGKPPAASTKEIPPYFVPTTLKPTSTNTRTPVTTRTTVVPSSTTPTTTTTTATSAPEPIVFVPSETIVASDNLKPIMLIDAPPNAEVVHGPLTVLSKNVSSNEIISHSEESIAAVTGMLQGNAAQQPEQPNDLLAQESEDISTIIPNASTMSEDASFSVDTVVTNNAAQTFVTVVESETTTAINDDDDEEDEDDSITGSYILKESDETEEQEYDSTTSLGTTEQSVATTIISVQSKDVKRNTSKAESKDVFSDIIDGVVETFGGGSSSEEDEEDGKIPVNDDANNDEDDDDDDDDFLGLDDDDDKDSEQDDEDEDDENTKKPTKKTTTKPAKKPLDSNKDNEDESTDDDDDEEEEEEEEDVKENDDEEQDSIEDAEDDDEDEDDDLTARRAKKHFRKQHVRGRGRQSRDMWLDRLHW